MIHKKSPHNQIDPKLSSLHPGNKEEYKYDSASLKSTSEQSERQGSVWRSRGLCRKLDDNRNSFQSYKPIRRQSQEKQPDIHQNKMSQPPKQPPTISDLTVPTNHQQPSISQSQQSYPGPEGQWRGEAAKFKKKAMSKEEIVEVKQYVRRLQLDRCETNSVGVSQQAGEGGDARGKEANKKSKTQYFSIEQIHGWVPVRDITENPSESESIYVASLKEKCKSVDENNSLLQKRLKWLMEEIEVHLERQAAFQNEREALGLQLMTKDRVLLAKDEENTRLRGQLRSKEAELRRREEEMYKLREFVKALNLKFQDDREILISEIEYLKSEQMQEAQEREAEYGRRIRQLEERIQQLEAIQNGGGERPEDGGGQYSQALFEKLVSENKYLRMENHMLVRYKEDVAQLKRENRQIANERDGLKKKIIQSVKKQALKFRMMDDSDSSSLLELSELSISIPQRRSPHHQSTP